MGSPERRARWGLFGGLFDPVHNGHLVLARDCRRLYRLDKVLFIPSLQPPHRPDGPVAAFDDRVAMLEAALSGEPGCEVSRIEAEIEGPGYTLRVIRECKKRYPGVDFYFIMGADNIRQIPGWYHPERIFEEATVLAGVRPGFEHSVTGLDSRFPVQLVATGAYAAASTDIRVMLERDRDNPRLAGDLPPSVLAYITKHGLYSHAKNSEADGLSR